MDVFSEAGETWIVQMSVVRAVWRCGFTACDGAVLGAMRDTPAPWSLRLCRPCALCDFFVLTDVHAKDACAPS